MKEITSSEEFRSKVLENENTVLVDFNADWCPPCQAQKPVLEKLGSDGYEIYGLNVDEVQEIATEYKISSIPCMVLFKGGKEVDRLVGLNPEKRIKKFMEQ